MPSSHVPTSIWYIQQIGIQHHSVVSTESLDPCHSELSPVLFFNFKTDKSQEPRFCLKQVFPHTLNHVQSPIAARKGKDSDFCRLSCNQLKRHLTLWSWWTTVDCVLCVWVRVCEREKEKGKGSMHTSTSLTSKSSECARQGFPYVSETELDPFNLCMEPTKKIRSCIYCRINT
jgi:hypothetical protein